MLRIKTTDSAPFFHDAITPVRRSLARLYRIGMIPLLSSLLVLAPAVSGWSQTERYPTNDEIDFLLQQTRRDMPRLLETGIYHDRRTSEERQQRDAFVAAWAEVNALVAPFLGGWSAIEETTYIFPTARTGEVCIIDMDAASSRFSSGRVTDNKVYTDLNLVLALDSGFLSSIAVYDGEANAYQYANPRPLIDPVISPVGESYPAMVEQFQAAGCLTRTPE
ncbi:MAG: hypothetical protein AAGE59_18840 [Cyanobacteria bacterium P01_F01_bin.86]